MSRHTDSDEDFSNHPGSSAYHLTATMVGHSIQKGSRGPGCWTCRLRRKKCDGHRPVCRNCAALEIACHIDGSKPEWMDGGPKQRQKAHELKIQIKESSNGRREKRGRQFRGFIVTSGADFAAQEPVREESEPPQPLEDETSGLGIAATQESATSVGDATKHGLFAPVLVAKRSNHIRSTYPNAQSGPSRDLIPESSTSSISELLRGSEAVSLNNGSQEVDLEMVMMYLDYDFPFLFPFYRAPMESRTWLLPFLMNNKAVLHSAQSLSSYFFNMALNDVFPNTKNQCKKSKWVQVVEEADKCFEKIQKDLRGVEQRGPQATVTEKARIMESIIQLLIFEMFIQISGDWKIHLDPAITLFEQILQSQPLGPRDGLLFALDTMGPHGPGMQSAAQRSGWNPDQAAFRFFTVILLFIDVVASTSLQQPPRLIKYHRDILMQPNYHDSTTILDMAAFIGCHNWVICALGEAAALNTWKVEMKAAGRLSMPDLVNRAQKISQSLERGLERLSKTTPSSALRSVNINRLQPYYDINLPKLDAGLAVAPTRIWTHAVFIYLSVTVSGWQPLNTEIRQHVKAVLDLLQDVKCSAQIRTFAWPLCIAGCFAQPGGQEQAFRNIIAGSGDLLRTPGHIMEAVWSQRDSLDCEKLDIGACLGILGEPCLLIQG